MHTKIENVSEIKNKLICFLEEEMEKGLSCINTDEAGKVIDMIKDLAEAEEKGWKACYYKTIIDDMYSYDQNDRMGYDNWRYSSGRFAPKGKGHYSGFTTPYVSMPEPIMTDRMGYYEEYVEAKDHYHSTHSTDDKNKMIEKAKAYISETSTEMKELWNDSDPDMRRKIKSDLTTLINDLT